jgi:outer membrane protein OmpA-like peptidoglycan-associated protein
VISFRKLTPSTFLATALLCGISLGALAQTDNGAPTSPGTTQRERGFYVGGGVGGNFQEDNKFTGSGTNSTTSYSAGPAGILNFGYALGNGLRFELEPGYRYNDADNGGRTQIFTGMVNGIYDFDTKTPVFPLTPHIGAGVGVAHLWNRSPQNGQTVVGQDDRPALQAIAGVEYDFTPAMKLGLDYRYLYVDNPQFRTQAGGNSQSGAFNDHALLLTMRYSFGVESKPAPQPVAFTPAPPPPAPVAQAAVPPPAYTVYFNFDRSDIEPSAEPIIQRAAGDAKNGKVTRIAVTGYTDLAGTAQYNQRLSERRAESVRAELVKLGVPSDEIVTTGRGKNDPIVPTADGVREPRNRRVEIVMQSPGV